MCAVPTYSAPDRPESDAIQVLFVIANPDVYKSPNSDCYIVFGESKIEDSNSQAQMSTAQQLGGGGGLTADQLTAPADDDDDDIPELEAPEDDGPVDETGVDPKDIDLVMTQVGCSRAKAVRVLKQNGGDLINASTSHNRSVSARARTDFVNSHGCKRVVLTQSLYYLLFSNAHFWCSWIV